MEKNYSKQCDDINKKLREVACALSLSLKVLSECFSVTCSLLKQTNTEVRKATKKLSKLNELKEE